MQTKAPQHTSKKYLREKKTSHSSFVTKQENVKAKTEVEIQDFLDRLTRHPSVSGLVLLGGLGTRNYIDQFSDIDIAIFTYEKNIKKVPLPFEFHYLTLSGRILEFNIHQQIIEHEQGAIWDESKKEAYSRGIIYFDPEGEIKKLIRQNTKFNKKEAHERLIYIVQQYEWRAKIHAIRACKRGFPEAGNDLVDESLDLLVEALYLLEKKYRPHRKWRLVYLNQFEIPKEIIEAIHEVKLTHEHTEAVVTARVKLLNTVFEYVRSKIRALYPTFPKNPYEHYYTNNVQLNAKPTAIRLVENWKDALSVDEYEKIKGLSCYNLSCRKNQFLSLIKTRDIDFYKKLV